MMLNSPLMLTVSGLRGIVGQTLTPSVAVRYGGAFAQYLLALRHHGERQNACATDVGFANPVHVVVGRDSRRSGQMLENAVVSGLLASGCQVTRVGIVSTPGVAVMAGHLRADGGLVISASHNPSQWNGIKPLIPVSAIDHRSSISHCSFTSPPPDEAQKIIDYFNQDKFAYVPADEIIPVSFNDNAAKVHRDIVLRHINPQPIREAGFKVVLDSVRGAGGREAIGVLEALGAWYMAYGAEPTGQFSHPPEPTKDNLEAATGIESLTEAMKIYSADVGFAQDPDADRLAVIDEKGRYIGEEYTYALCAKYLLTACATATTNSASKSVATNLSTSRMIDDVTEAENGRVIRAPVGEANVALAMRENGAVIGGEGNGGIIFAPVSYIRDSILGIAVVLALMAQERRPLSEIVGDIQPYTIVKEKIDLQNVPGTFKEIKQRLVEAFANQKIDLQDGVRIDWPDKWLHIRPSNTEPILRIIAEARQESEAIALIERARNVIG